MAERHFLDRFGNPVQLDALKEERAGPTVTGVRSYIAGHPSAGLTPQRLAGLLRAAEQGDPMRYLELAEDMEEKDLHYLGVLGTRKRQVAQLEITVEEGGEEQRHIDHKAFVEDWLNRAGLEDELFDILDAIGKGFSVTEILWETSAGQWWPRRLKWRDQRWFGFDLVDGETVRLRDEGGQLVPLDPFKFVVCSIKAKSGLPIRGGIARAAAWAYLFKNFDVKGWVSFAEVYGQPLRLGKYHAGATDKEKAALLQAVASIGRDAAAIVPEGMVIEFVKTEVGSSSELFERLANYMDRQVSKAVLGQTTTTDAISGGHAVSKEHNEVREDIERADAKALAGVLNEDVVRPLIDLNFGPQDVYPLIRIGRPEKTDTSALTTALAALVPLGLRVSQAEVRAKLRLEEPEDDDEILMPPRAAPIPGPDDPEGAPAGLKPAPTGEEAGAAAALRARRAGTRGIQTLEEAALVRAAAASRRASPAARDEIDDLADKALAATNAAMTAIVDQLRDIVGEASDLADLGERVAESYPTLDIEGLAELIGLAMAEANLLGRADLVDDAARTAAPGD